MSLKKVIASLKKNNSFLVTSHISLEGDALGSELAIYRLLMKLGKRAIVVNEDGLPYGYDFLPDLDKLHIRSRVPQSLKFDCFLAVDCSDLNRMGGVYKLNNEKKPVVNIDHHISNSKFGDINWVEPGASSSSEMVYKLYKALKVPLDKDSATLLYTGMLTDTGSFHYPNTSSFTHKAVSDLLKYKLDISTIYKSVYEDIPFRDLKLLAQLLPCVKLFAKGRLACCVIRGGVLKKKKLSFDLTEHVLSYARSIKGVEVVALLKQNFGRKGEVRVNLRSQGKVDVNRIAAYFGGGGHKTASGATLRGNIETIRRKVIRKIEESLR